MHGFEVGQNEHPYFVSAFPEYVTQVELPRGFKMKYFLSLLTKHAFTWFKTLPPNSINTWAQLEGNFHEAAHTGYVEPVSMGINMVEVSIEEDDNVEPISDEKLEEMLDDFTKEEEPIYPKEGDSLIEFLSKKKDADREVMLCPRCSAIFDRAAPKAFEESEVMKSYKAKKLREKVKPSTGVMMSQIHMPQYNDEYPMPIVETMIDVAVGNEIMSLLDGYSGYNQIYIAANDVSKTAFRCPGALGIYEWVMMPFGLKNAGATYQREMNLIFHDLIGKFVQVYIDDIIVGSKRKEEHLCHLKFSLERMRKHGLKMNPLKCAFGVTSGEFLGFIIHQKGIEVDRNKTKAIMETRPPSNKKELQSLLGKVNFPRRFISNLSGKTKVFSPLLRLKKEEEFRWEEEHQKAFEEIKSYLAHPLVIAPPSKRKKLKLYISANDLTIAGMLAQDLVVGPLAHALPSVSLCFEFVNYTLH
uniref:Retrotransposable element Tf2 n=1 Tax=Cajanus cajan TaxID=3821 RepID=A0A151RTH0_CAJCA|nr:Retrotransposable element Tf2 [Cajanus cajan]